MLEVAGNTWKHERHMLLIKWHEYRYVLSKSGDCPSISGCLQVPEGDVQARAVAMQLAILPFNMLHS